MPANRRRSTAQIAKVNARSIDGYFGVGTDCFFIRGTVLSDVLVGGEYRTLTIQRPGNVIEIEAFDGEWATVTVATRAGNRPGDNIRARLFLREVDLRTVGIDCERIMSAGIDTIEQPDEPPVLLAPPPLAEAAAAPTAPRVAPDDAGDGAATRAEPAREWFRFFNRSLLGDGRVFVEIGASLVAIALPVVIFFLLELFGRRDET